MRLRLWGLATILGGALVLSGAPPGAARTTTQADGGCVLPGGIDSTLAQQFESDLQALVEEHTGGTVDASTTLADLAGFSGKFDLEPGQPVAGAVLADLSGLPCPETGGGSKLEGDCVGMMMSFDGKGQLLDIAADFDPDGAPIDVIASRESGNVVRALSKSNPFQVDLDGFVAYVGTAGQPGDGPKDHHWSISTFGVDVDSGGDPNDDGKNFSSGTFRLGNLPAIAKINAKFQVSGQLDSANGLTCRGAGYFETRGGLPIADGIGAAALIVAGLGAIFNARPVRRMRG